LTAVRTALASALAVFAQLSAPPPPRAAETFDLDISEKRIHEPDFHAETALLVDPGDGGIRVQVGAGVSARAIDLLLRNVHGSVRFRADTSRLGAVRSLPTPPRPATPDSDQQ
jgi:hypothetical protein